MKKQETVNKNFQSVRAQWEAAQEKKVRNIELQQENIKSKMLKLKEQYNKLESQKRSILQQEGPVPPTEERRASQAQSAISKSSTFSE